VIKRVSIPVMDFDLDQIFDCGQCFRWYKEEDGSWSGVAFGKAVNMSLDSGILTIEGADEKDFNELWYQYLDLERDYGSIKSALSQKDDVIGIAIGEGEGIRILKQDLWETVISFIISANNNIPRIKGCIEKLCQMFGQPIGEFRGQMRYSFPAAEVLANLEVEDLAPVKLGYRAKYIVETAKKFSHQPEVYEDLLKEEVSGQQATKVICKDKDTKLMGVGPKVANCIVLFGLGKMEGFPIDVWMKRVMNHLYGFDEEDVSAMSTFAEEHFGQFAGIAQQYLFYYMRNKIQ
jgi:N-glycosylase/DNA lyase